MYCYAQTDVAVYEESLASNYPNIRLEMVATNNSIEPNSQLFVGLMVDWYLII